MLSSSQQVFKDPNHEKNSYLTKEEAYKRSSLISETKYRLTMAPRKGGDSFMGKVIVEFNLSQDATRDHDKYIFGSKWWQDDARSHVLIMLQSNCSCSGADVGASLYRNLCSNSRHGPPAIFSRSVEKGVVVYGVVAT